MHNWNSFNVEISFFELWCRPSLGALQPNVLLNSSFNLKICATFAWLSLRGKMSFGPAAQSKFCHREASPAAWWAPSVAYNFILILSMLWHVMQALRGTYMPNIISEEVL